MTGRNTDHTLSPTTSAGAPATEPALAPATAPATARATAPRRPLIASGPAVLGLTAALTAVGLLAVWGFVEAVPSTLAPPATARIALVVTYPLVAMGAVLLATHATVSDESDRRPAIWAFVVATIGVVVAAVRLAWSVGGDGTAPTGWLADLVGVGEIAVALAVAVLACSVAIAVRHSVRGSGRPDPRLALGVTLLALAHLLVGTAGRIDAVDAIASLAATSGSSLFLLAALTLARGTLRNHRLAAIDLAEQLRESRGAHAASRERLHAVANSVAGVTSAQRLLREGHDLPVEYRRRLEEMLDSETRRLEEMLSGRSSTAAPVAPVAPVVPVAPVTAEPAAASTDADADAVADDAGRRPLVRAPRPRRAEDGLTLAWTTSSRAAAGGTHVGEGASRRVADSVSAQ